MHKEEKIKEAEYFLQRMDEEKDNREHFNYNLSAFLSSARSVMQYAFEEVEPEKNASTKPGAKAWYDNLVSASPILEFFKDKRDVNIHIEPVKPRADFATTIKESIGVSESVSVTIKRKNGSVETQTFSDKSKPKPKKSEAQVSTEVIYRFADWSGNEDVFDLCQKHIQELKKVVKEGINKGYITA